MNNKATGRFLETTNYDIFFHPNSCHVCKSTENLIECPLCGMISYCSQDHLMKHRENHEEICEAIIYLSKDRDIWDSCDMTPDEWLNFKKDNMRCIQRIVERDLKPYEKEMFLFAKSCIVCRSQKSLSSCELCMSVYACPEHELTRQHACLELWLSTTLDWHYIYCVERNCKISAKYMHLIKNMVRDMRSFLRFMRLDLELGNIRAPETYIYSDDFTGPLTLIYGMLQAHLFHCLQKRSSNVVIHFLVEQHIALRTLTAWELVLHELRAGTKLAIISIGPELYSEHTFDYELCRTCRSKLNKCISDNYCMFYHDYVNSIYYSRPDVIVAFDIDFRDKEESSKIIKAFQRQNCPLLLTAKSEIETQRNAILIQKILGSYINPIINEKNKFASLRPYRYDKDDSVFYHNQYVTVYRDLKDSSDSIQYSISSNDFI